MSLVLFHKLAISEEIMEADIEACHQVPTQNPDKHNIVVEFKSWSKRDAALRKAKRLCLTNKSIDLDSDALFYVNEHLCPSLKCLLGVAIQRKRKYGWKSVGVQWTNF